MQSISERPNILLVGDFSASKLGNESVVEDLARRLIQADYEVTTTSDKFGRLSRVSDMLLTTWRARGKIDVASIDVFSGRAFLWAEGVCSILKRANVPFALVLHGGSLPEFAQLHPNRVRKLFGAAAQVSTPSAYLGQQLSEFLKEYKLIPNPIDIGSYHFRLRSEASPTLVWLRSFHYIYNPVMVPKLIKRLSREFNEVRVVMVGGDKNDGSLSETKRVAQSLGVASNIEFVGAVSKPEVPKWLSQGDIFINTSRTDNTPVSVIEAMATGLCVVSTEVGGIPYLLENKENALLTPSDDPEAMAQAVSNIISSPQLSARLSANARRLAETFDWKVVLPQWETLFQTMAPAK